MLIKKKPVKNQCHYLKSVLWTKKQISRITIHEITIREQILLSRVRRGATLKKKKKEKGKKRDRRTIDDETHAPNPLSQTFLVNGTLGWLLAHRLSHPPNKKSSCGDKRVARRRTFAAIFHGKGDRGQIRCAFLSIIISYSSRNFVNIFWLGRYFHLWRISFLVHDSSWQYLKTFIAEKFN